MNECLNTVHAQKYKNAKECRPIPEDFVAILMKKIFDLFDKMFRVSELLYLVHKICQLKRSIALKVAYE